MPYSVQAERLIKWLKQPSTWKAFVIVGSLLGASVTEDKVKEFVEVGLILYAGIACFWDQN